MRGAAGLSLAIGHHQGKDAKGLPWARHARSLLPRTRDLEAVVLNSYGVLHFVRGEYDGVLEDAVAVLEAALGEKHLEFTLSAREEALGEQSVTLLPTLIVLIALERAREDLDAARAYGARALELAEAGLEPDHPDRVELNRELERLEPHATERSPG